MIELDQHTGAYLSICKHYRAILATPSVKENKEDALLVLQNVVLYLVLSPYDNEQADLAHRIKEDVQLEEIPPYKYVFNFLRFLLREIQRSFGNVYESGNYPMVVCRETVSKCVDQWCGWASTDWRFCFG